MAESADDPSLHWIDPERRGILPLEALHVSRSLRKTVLRGDYTVTIDRRFDEIVKSCAARDTTWINEKIARLYNSLHRSGYAHSVEVTMDGELAGGLYGVALGGVFFGESMFSLRTDASKIALVYLVARLRSGEYSLLDTQFVTDHLASLGAVEISRNDYQTRLSKALNQHTNFWKLPENTSPQFVLQLSTQIS